MLISKARELGIPLSEYLDQITTEYHGNKDDDLFHVDITPIALRGLYLQQQLYSMKKIALKIESSTSETDKHKLQAALLSLVIESYKENKEMRSEEFS